MPETVKRRDLVKRYWPGLSWALLIFILSSISPPSLKIPRLFDLFEPDKVGHFCFYAVLFLLLDRGARPGVDADANSSVVRIYVFLLTIAYGGLIEIYQGYLLSDRVADWIDFIANIIGACLGVLITRIPIYKKLIS